MFRYSENKNAQCDQLQKQDEKIVIVTNHFKQ